MKKVLVDKILLIIIAVACCVLIIPLSADLPPYWMLISIPFFWLAKLFNKNIQTSQNYISQQRIVIKKNCWN